MQKHMKIKIQKQKGPYQNIQFKFKGWMVTCAPFSAISLGGTSRGFSSTRRMRSFVSILNESGRTRIWLLLISNSSSISRFPMDRGKYRMSAKLFPMFILTREVAKHKLSGTDSSSLKLTSSSFRFVKDDIVVGSCLILLYRTDKISRL